MGIQLLGIQLLGIQLLGIRVLGIQLPYRGKLKNLLAIKGMFRTSWLTVERFSVL